MKWIFTLACALVLSGCLSYVTQEKQSGEHCGANAECRSQQQKERDAVAMIESALIIGATEAIVDAVTKEKAPTR